MRNGINSVLRFGGSRCRAIRSAFRWALAGLALWSLAAEELRAEVTTWDGKRYRIERIEVTVVYFVPRDCVPLPDWKERVHYFCRRIERFHRREFQEQSVLRTVVRAEPFRSERSTDQLRDGDANFLFFQTLNEVDEALKFAQGERAAFPILLVLSDINWRPLDDFYRVKPGHDDQLEFEGNYNAGRHFPGAASGGARATYLADRGVGWGLVSGDGWRVPYSGTDCVVYHEGVGHSIGLPHPEPADDSVMSLGQYHGWISESWLDDDQKKRLGWVPPEKALDRRTDLFSVFKALPEPLVPAPNQPVALRLVWPESARARSCRVRVQTDLYGAWLDISPERASASGALPNEASAPGSIALGRFDRPTPVSYRVDAVLADGQDVELWGYFQVREKPDIIPLPSSAGGVLGPSADRRPAGRRHGPSDALDLLSMVEIEKDQVSGEWRKSDGVLVAPKEYAARVELPYEPPDEYELVVIAEPLDEPNGLILGQRSGGRPFLALLNFAAGASAPQSALENIDGKNVGVNATTVQRAVLAKNRPSQIICTVRKDSVSVTCDGQLLLDWTGDPQRLSLSEYWNTPHDNALFLGTYDCRYRFHRVTLTPLSGQGKRMR